MRVRAQAGAEKTPLLVVCVGASKQKEKKFKQKQGEKCTEKEERKISAAFAAQRTSEATNQRTIEKRL